MITTSKSFRYIKSWILETFYERQVIWLSGSIILTYATLSLAKSPGSFPLFVVISILFSSINIFRFFFKRKNDMHRWNLLYLLIAILLLTPLFKATFVYYNVFLHAFFIIAAITVLFKRKSKSHDLFNRLKFLALANIIVLSIPALQLHFYLAAGENLKIWDNSLKWSDFKGEKLGDKEEYVALIYTGFNYKYNKVYSIPRVTSITLMAKDKSWASAVYAKYNTNKLLNHEKIHFDISEWSRREFQDSISTLKDISESKVKDIAIYYGNLNVERQLEYDSITNNGTNFIKQQEWNEKIHHIFNN